MTPKQRVLTTFAHKEPDRVPINYYANPGIDKRLKEHYGLAVDDNEGLRQKLGVDFRGGFPGYIGPRLHAEIPDRIVDPAWGIHTRYIEHESGAYWDYCDFPLKDADYDTVKKWPMPSPDDFDYGVIEKTFKEYPDYAIHIGDCGIADFINSNSMVRGMENILMDFALDNPAGLLLIDRKLEIQLEVTRRCLEIAKGRYDFMWIGEDLGTQHTPLISMEMFRKHIRPRHQKFVDLAKKHNLPVMIHTCGSSSWAYEDFVEMGINAVDTLQPEATNMSPEYLKKHFGGRLSFHGCISTAGPVAYGSVEDVVENVRQTLDIMMPNGGYCFAPTHALQDNSPTENVVAMYDAAKEFGRYK